MLALMGDALIHHGAQEFKVLAATLRLLSRLRAGTPNPVLQE